MFSGKNREVLDLENNELGFCPAHHQQMDQQQLADQEFHCDPVTSAVSSSDLAQLPYTDLEVGNMHYNFMKVFQNIWKYAVIFWQTVFLHY